MGGLTGMIYQSLLGGYIYMIKKNIMIILGAVVFCMAWFGITSRVQNYQVEMKVEKFPAQFQLIQDKWSRFTNFEVEQDIKKISGPAEFLLAFQAEPDGLFLQNAVIKNPSVEFNFTLVKRVFLDTGKKEGIFTYYDDVNDDRFLVQAVQEGENFYLKGFPLDTIINYLNVGLEGDDWFVLGENNKVLAAYEKSYIGQTYKFGKHTISSKFKTRDKSYSFGVIQKKPLNLALVNIFGVLGVILISFAFMVRQDSFDPDYKEKTADKNSIAEDYGFGQILKKENRLSLSSLDKQIALEESAEQQRIEQQVSVSGQKENPEEGDIFNEEMQLLNLVEDSKPNKTSEKNKATLSYSDFLIENPMLTNSEQAKITENLSVEAPVTPDKAQKISQKVVESPAVKEPLPEDKEDFSTDEWMRLAEELSANIEEYSQSQKRDKAKEQEA